MTDIAGPRYYRHSGQAPFGGLLGGLLGTAAAAGVLGAAFGFLELYAHTIPAGKLMFIAILLGQLGLGAAIGATAAGLFKRGKVRNTPLAVLGALASCAVALYLAWAFWIWALTLYLGQRVPLAHLLSPATLWDVVLELNAQGVWTISRNDKPTGAVLWAFWGAETLIIAGTALVVTVRRMNASVFCETCQRWGTARALVQTRAGDPQETRRALEAGDFSCLARLGRPAGEAHWFEVSLEGCPNCDNLQTLNLERVTRKTDAKGNISYTRRWVVRRLRLTPEQTVEVAAIAAGLQSPDTTAA